MNSVESGVRRDRTEKYIVYAILFVFVSFFVYWGYSFIKLDTGPKFTDCQYFRALDYYNFFVAGEKNNLFCFSFRELAYPPFTFLVSQFFFAFLGTSMEAARISILFFAAIFIIASFGCGYELGGIPGGVTAFAVVASSPFIMEFSRLYFLDFPQTAMTALAFYALIKTNFFSDRKYSILFGVALSLAFLTKWSAAFYLWFPILFCIVAAFIRDKSGKGEKLQALIPVVFICSAVVVFFIQAGNPANRGAGWIMFYLLLIVLPSYFAFRRFPLVWGKNAKPDNQEEKVTGNMVNGLYSFLVFALLTAPWYLWASRRIKEKFLDDMSLHNTLKMSFDYLKMFFSDMFAVQPLFWILILCGIAAVFIIRGGKFYLKLMTVVWLPVQILFIMKYGFPEPRYLLTFVFIGAVIASLSMNLFGKAAGIIAPVLGGAALTLVAGWAFFTPFGHHDFNRVNYVYYPWLPGCRINIAREPDRNVVDLTPLGGFLEPLIKKNNNLRIYIVDLPGNPGEDYNLGEYLQEYLFFKRKLRPIVSNVFVGGLENNYTGPGFKSENPDDTFLIFHRGMTMNSSRIEKIAEKLGLPAFRIERYSIGNNYYVTIIRR